MLTEQSQQTGPEDDAEVDRSKVHVLIVEDK